MQSLQSQVLVHIECIGNGQQTKAIMNQSLCQSHPKKTLIGPFLYLLQLLEETQVLGKSTCLSSIAMMLDPTLNLSGKEAFKSSDSLCSFTKGIHCLPIPVFHPSNRKVQILLLDIEGMGGINEGINHETQKIIQRQINLLAMLICSNFVMMSTLRPSSSIFTELKISFQNIMDIQSNLYVSPPKFFILIKDRQKQLEENEQKEFLNFIKKNIGISDDLVSYIALHCLSKLPKNFDSQIRDYTAMKNTDYSNSLENLVQKQISHTKSNFPVGDTMTVQQLAQLIKVGVDSFNTKDFMVFFIQNQEQYIGDLCEPIVFEQIKIFMKNLEILQKSVQKELDYDNKSQQHLNQAMGTIRRNIQDKLKQIQNTKNPKYQDLIQNIINSSQTELENIKQQQKMNFKQILTKKQIEENQKMFEEEYALSEQIKEIQLYELENLREEEHQKKTELQNQINEAEQQFLNKQKENEKIIQQLIDDQKKEQKRYEKYIQELQNQYDQQNGKLGDMEDIQTKSFGQRCKRFLIKSTPLSYFFDDEDK